MLRHARRASMAIAALAVLAAGRPADASFLWLSPSSSSVLPGDTVDLTVNLRITAGDAGFELASAQVALVFDPARMEIPQNPTLGASLAGFNASGTNDFSILSNRENAQGRVRINVADNAALGTPLPLGNYQLMTVRVRLFPTVPFGPLRVDLVRSVQVGQTTFLTLVEDVGARRLTLSPGPENGLDLNDALLNVVPEPSSMALAGLGGLILAAAARRRAGR